MEWHHEILYCPHRFSVSLERPSHRTKLLVFEGKGEFFEGNQLATIAAHVPRPDVRGRQTMEFRLDDHVKNAFLADPQLVAHVLE